MVLVGREVDLGNVRAGEDSGFSEEQVARSLRRESGLFRQDGRENVDRKSTSEFRYVAIGISGKRKPARSVLVTRAQEFVPILTHLMKALHLIL